MATPLYVIAINQMLENHSELFNRFEKIHIEFSRDQSGNKTEFDLVGKEVTRLIEETEQRLCAKMENSNRGKFSSSLSDKFRAEIRRRFPLIDLVGVTIN